MARISDLPDLPGSVEPGDILPINRGGATYKTPLDDIGNQSAERAERLKSSVIGRAGGAERITCLLTGDGEKVFKAGTVANEIDIIRPLLPETGVKFAQAAVTWNAVGSPVAPLAVRPVKTGSGIAFTREVGLTARNDANAQIGLMPDLTDCWSMAVVLRMPAVTEYASVAAMNADLANKRVGDLARVTGAAGPTAGGGWEEVPADCISCLPRDALASGFYTGGLYVRGNGAWNHLATGSSATLIRWHDSAAPTTRFATIGIDCIGRLYYYGYDGTTQISDVNLWGAGSDFLTKAQAGPVIIEVEKDRDGITLYANGVEWATYHGALNMTPDRFYLNGSESGNATIPVSGVSFTLAGLIITNGLDYRQVLETHNELARALGAPERRWCPVALLAVFTDQSRFVTPVGGSSSAVSSTPSIPDPVSNWAFNLERRGSNTDSAIIFPSRELVPNLFTHESAANPTRLGPARVAPNIYGSTSAGAGSRTLNGTGAESIEWGFARELFKAPGAEACHLYMCGYMVGGASDELLKAENAGQYLHDLLDYTATVSNARSIANRAAVACARRARKRGQEIRLLFVGNFQGETLTGVAGNNAIEGKLREDDLKAWLAQLTKITSPAGPTPVLGAKSVMFSTDGTGNSYNVASGYFKDNQILERESPADPGFRFIEFGATGNWMGRGIHWEVVFQRLYGMIIGDRVRRTYFEGERTGATKITSAAVGTGGSAGKIVLNVNRRLTVDAGGNPLMPGTYKSDGLNGAGYLTYGLIFESHATETVTLAGVPADGDTVTIGATVYTFRDKPRAAYAVGIGNSAAECAANLMAAIHGAGTVYLQQGPGTVANTGVFGTVAGAVVRLYAIAKGTAGNGIALAKAGANIAVGSPTLNGADDVRAISGNVTFVNGTRIAQVSVPIGGTGPKVGDVIKVTGEGVLFSNFREEAVRTGYYKTQAWDALPLADTIPALNYTADAILSDYLAPQRVPVTA